MKNYLLDFDDYERLTGIDSAQWQRGFSAPNDNRGNVYLLQYGNIYKIGKTGADVKYRAAQIVAKNKLLGKLEVIWEMQVADMHSKEKELHSCFAEKRISGEWYFLAPEDVAYIKSLGGES